MAFVALATTVLASCAAAVNVSSARSARPAVHFLNMFTSRVLSVTRFPLLPEEGRPRQRRGRGGQASNHTSGVPDHPACAFAQAPLLRRRGNRSSTTSRTQESVSHGKANTFS